MGARDPAGQTRFGHCRPGGGALPVRDVLPSGADVLRGSSRGAADQGSGSGPASSAPGWKAGRCHQLLAENWKDSLPTSVEGI